MTLSVLDALSWFGVLTQIAGAMALAERWWRPSHCYQVMMVGAVSLFFAAAARLDGPIVTLQAMYVLINLRGYFRWGRT